MATEKDGGAAQAARRDDLGHLRRTPSYGVTARQSGHGHRAGAFEPPLSEIALKAARTGESRDVRGAPVNA